MAQFDANINLIVNAQKAYKQIADLENRLDKLSNPKTKRQIQGVITQSKSDLRASEQRLSNQIRLNAALERQANLVKGLTRAGVSGGRKGRVEELTEVGKKFKDNLGIQNAVNTALEKELQTLREINRTDRAQSATSSKVLTSVKQRLDALKAVGATASEINKIEKKRDALVSQNARKQTDLAKESFSQLDRQLATLERKYSTFLGTPGRQLASPIRGSKDTPGSPLYLEAQAKAADKAAAAAKRLADQQLRSSKAAGGPRSPIGGSTSIPGSPKFLAAQAKQLNEEELKINRALDTQRKLREKNARVAKRLAATQAKNAKRAADDAKRARQNRIQGLQLGIGFPLLFGGGVGSVAGGALGALSDSSGGFGGQILFSALGQQIDTFIQNLGNLADSLDSAESILDGLADAGLRVSKELRSAVETLEDQGRFIEAYNVALGELERRFGPNAVQELANYDAANAALQEEFSKAASTLQKELLPSLTLVTQAVAGLLGLINQSGGILKFLAGLIPGVGPSISAASTIGNEGARRITSSPTNAFGFQSNTGASAAADKERLAREKESADLVRQINRNQEAFSRAREEAARKELKHQQDVLKLVRDRVLLEAQLIQDQLRLQAAQRSFQLEQARAKAAGESALLSAEQEAAGAALDTLRAGGTSPGYSSPEQVFASKLAIEYDLINKKVKELGDLLLQSGATTEAIRTATASYKDELRAAAEQAIRLEQARFKTTEELFAIRTAFLKQEAQILSETDEKAAKLLERQLVLARATQELEDAGVDPTSTAGTAYIDAVLAKFDAANKSLSDFEKQLQSIATVVSTQLTQALEQALVETIGAAITGADDLAEKLQNIAANLLSTLGSALFRIGIGGIGTIGQPGSGSGLLGQIFNREGGGPVTPNRPYIVGEREPELFVPKSAGTIYNQDQMQAAFSNYSPGNEALIPAGKPGEYTINYNGPTLNFNDNEYIPRSEAQSLIAAGAKQGEARTLNSLRNKRSTRSRIGI